MIGIIGCGNMAEAFITGFLNKNILTKNQIFAVEPNNIQKRKIKSKYGISFASSVKTLCEKSRVILISVKPQNIKEILPELAPHLNQHLVLTIVAGVPVKLYQSYLGTSLKIIRIMPNTPALIGQGMSVFYASKNCVEEDKTLCNLLLRSVSLVEEVHKEELLDPVTAVSGSGPAFVYQFALAMIKAGTRLGLTHTLCHKLVLQTLSGATQLMQQSTDTLEELTAKVATKGGTTFAGLEVWKKKGFYDIVYQCILAATKRAQELKDDLK